MAAQEARRLMREAGETVHLVVYDPPHVVYIDKVENETNLRMGSRIGSRAPAYCTAVGKAILAWLPEESVEVAVAAGMPPITAHTITDGAAFRVELTRIRERGSASTTGRTNRRCAASARPSSTTATRSRPPCRSPA